MTTLFVVVLTYIRPLEEVDAAGPAHVAWLRQGYDRGVFLVSGRRVPRTGGVIIAKAASLPEVEALMREDPFQRMGLATAQIVPFEANMLSEAMRPAL